MLNAVVYELLTSNISYVYRKKLNIGLSRIVSPFSKLPGQHATFNLDNATIINVADMMHNTDIDAKHNRHRSQTNRKLQQNTRQEAGFMRRNRKLPLGNILIWQKQHVILCTKRSRLQTEPKFLTSPIDPVGQLLCSAGDYKE